MIVLVLIALAGMCVQAICSLLIWFQFIGWGETKVTLTTSNSLIRFIILAHKIITLIVITAYLKEMFQ